MLKVFPKNLLRRCLTGFYLFYSDNVEVCLGPCKTSMVELFSPNQPTAENVIIFYWDGNTLPCTHYFTGMKLPRLCLSGIPWVMFLNTTYEDSYLREVLIIQWPLIGADIMYLRYDIHTSSSAALRKLLQIPPHSKLPLAMRHLM